MNSRPLLFLAAIACSGGGSDRNAYPSLQQVTLESGPQRFRVWVADDAASREEGLMNATAEDLAPRSDGALRGMLFVFPGDAQVSFWMKDTEVPLDLAYLDADGEILAVHALIPLDETRVLSPGPIRYALEVRAGDLGLGVGDFIAIPGNG